MILAVSPILSIWIWGWLWRVWRFSIWTDSASHQKAIVRLFRLPRQELERRESDRAASVDVEGLTGHER